MNNDRLSADGALIHENCLFRINPWKLMGMGAGVLVLIFGPLTERKLMAIILQDLVNFGCSSA
jgi:hypothetical protein